MTIQQHTIAIFCVNYNSYHTLNSYLTSIDKAAEAVRSDAKISVFVADNTVPAQPNDYEPQFFTLQILPTGDNLGYFGAIRYAMQQVSPSSFDYTIISNVDVLLSMDFFTQLIAKNITEDIGWIAPEIYSQAEHRDRNPKILQRYTKRKLQVLKMKFKYSLLNWLYNNTLYRSKKLAKHSAGQIYAGHGSFIILTQQFFTKCGIIDYPVFLFCEEIYLAEKCREYGLKVIYSPDIKVSDMEHASTSTFHRSRYCRLNYDAISYILDTYY